MLRGTAANGRRNGVYRGAMDFSAGLFSGVNAVNSLPLDTYVRGVVGDESPPSWPLEALKAQAVAARTYALTTMKPTASFDVYPDTRSQVYGGIAAEEASTDAAVAQTSGEVVTYNGQPVVTYFFSTVAGAPRTSRTRRSATSRGRGSSRSTTPTTPCRRATAGGRSSCRSRRPAASSAAW